jgi:hypothetical protein
MATDKRITPVLRDVSASAKNCPLAAPERATILSRVLHRACLIVGGMDRLAKQLRVPATDLERWMRAQEDPPEAVFLNSVEIIVLHAEAQNWPS